MNLNVSMVYFFKDHFPAFAYIFARAPQRISFDSSAFNLGAA